MTEITREIFELQRRPRFGTANPERMQLAFWEWMIRGDASMQAEQPRGLDGDSVVMRDGKLKNSYGPYRARDLFGVSLNRDDGPIWTFDRMGATRNSIPDRRVVCVGGEHEDFYDPDFCIYNDVIVLDKGEIHIYGYPKEIFPPTDFHTATAVAHQLIIIGGLGYKNERFPGHTPVYALDLSDFHISKIETSGSMPGWIHEHSAGTEDGGTITVRGGEVVRDRQGEQVIVCNFEDYVLDLNSRIWRRTTDRNWHQARIRRVDKAPLPLKPYAQAEALLPSTIRHTLLECTWREARISIENVEISIKARITDIQIVVRGHLPEELLSRLSEEIQMNAQILTKSRCSLEAL